MPYKIDPFTRTPGIAGNAYIDMKYADTIIANFESEESYKYVYKIVGLRGSGKSVEYSKIIKYFREKAHHKNWLVYTLSSANNPIEALISFLSREKFVDDKKHSTTISSGGSVSGKLLLAEGNAEVGISKHTEENDRYYSQEVILEEMIKKANEKGFHILIGIDDIAKTPQMVQFLSIFGKMLLDGDKKLYLVCTGIAKNIEDVANEASLTFFKRSDQLEIKGLDKYEVADMYMKLLGVSQEQAAEFSKFVKGYAYAYQVLGTLYFQKTEKETFENILPAFDKILFRDSYELIWQSLTEAEKQLVKLIVQSETGKVADIKNKMEKPANYNMLKERIDKKHILSDSERGYVRIDLPRFKEFVELWG